MVRDLSPYLFMPEPECVEKLTAALDWDGARSARVAMAAQRRVVEMRASPRKVVSVENFFKTYGLNTEEGVALMCLAEALLRIPDAATQNLLIHDKVSRMRWADSKSSDWLLRLTGLGLSMSKTTLESPFAKLGEPLIRKALSEGMKILGSQFVLGETIEEALKNAKNFQKDHPGLLFSFDMLGEGARTREDAARYFESYAAAIEAIGKASRVGTGRPGLSVKLSALYPRYTAAQEEFCIPALTAALSALCRRAAQHDIAITVDAEESERLETSLKIISGVLSDVTLSSWEGFGLAVQAYGKRALPLIETLIETAREKGRRFQIRLVKGAYWDAEIKRAQMKGLADYPVFTRKAHTDLSYLVCAQKMLQARDVLYPMFGTHNAHTVAAIVDMAGNDRSGFEFQRLFGMGETLYERVLQEDALPVRIYAPVGHHADLLAYLVRRLLENGANSSFVNKAFDEGIPPSALTRDPFEAALENKGCPHPSIALAPFIFEERKNAKGWDLDDAGTRHNLLAAMERAFDGREIVASSLIDGRQEKSGNSAEIRNPADRDEEIGTVYDATPALVEKAYQSAARAFPDWNATPAAARADILNKIADMYEDNAAMLMMLCVREAGKSLPDAVAELREAVDFCRYYAALGKMQFDENGQNLSSYTGESNKILLQGRGVFACISPWNFPLAIFTGQIAAALMAGNAVVAKPAEQTPFTAQAAIALMHRAGVPAGALHLLTGDGRVGEMMVQHARVAGVAFTGSNAAALAINRALSAKDGAIVPFIAETGGINAIVADSSALTEQLVDDVILSAFGSAGQRCSAARVLFVQEEVADKTISMLRGAMEELKVGNPRYYATDIGPLIDEEALAALQRHKSALQGIGTFIAEAPLPETLRQRGHYFAPIAFEILSLSDLKAEIFGPVLHVIRYKSAELPNVFKAINDTGYGLTFGLHTRLDGLAGEAVRSVNVGNIYINRSIIGAVVGVQPFGGTGLSGTGPKAGGPHYLHRFAAEKTISINTTAAGGNASLVMLEE